MKRFISWERRIWLLLRKKDTKPATEIGSFAWKSSCGHNFSALLIPEKKKVQLSFVDRAGMKEGWEVVNANYTRYGWGKVKSFLKSHLP